MSALISAQSDLVTGCAPRALDRPPVLQIPQHVSQTYLQRPTGIERTRVGSFLTGALRSPRQVEANGSAGAEARIDMGRTA